MSDAAAELQCVIFSLGEETFAVPVATVREILAHQEAFRIPYGPDYLLGLRDVRGQGVPVIDLRMKLGMTPAVKTADTRTLVLDVPIGVHVLALGLVADKVHEVTPFRRDQIEAARSETDPQQQLALWAEAQRLIHAEICAIPLFNLRQVWLRSPRLDFGYDLEGAMNLIPPITELTSLRAE